MAVKRGMKNIGIYITEIVIDSIDGIVNNNNKNNNDNNNWVDKRCYKR